MYRASGLFKLDDRVFLSRNCRLIVAPRKCNVLKANICPRSERANGQIKSTGTWWVLISKRKGLKKLNSEMSTSINTLVVWNIGIE